MSQTADVRVDLRAPSVRGTSELRLRGRAVEGQLAALRGRGQSWARRMAAVRGDSSMGGRSSSVRLHTSSRTIRSGFVVVAVCGGDGGQVELGDLLVRRGEGGEFGGGPGDGQVALVEGVAGDEVGDVDDGAQQVLVEPVAFVHPGPAAGPELVEGLAGDQAEGPAEVGDAVGAAGFAADAEPAEQVGVDQQVLDLVDADAAVLAGGGVAGIG